MNQKVTGERWHIHTEHQLQGFIEHIHRQWEDKRYPTVQFLTAARTVNQNALFHAIVGELARKLDQTPVEVKRDLKLRYGVPILRAANPEFCALYDERFKDSLTYEQKLLLMDFISVTSELSKQQFSQMLDQICVDYQISGEKL